MQTKTVDIGNASFVLSPIPPFRALAMFGDLQKLIAPVLAGLIGDVGKDANASAEDVDLGAVIRSASERFDGQTLEKWAKDLLQADWISVSIDGRPHAKLDAAMREMTFQDAGQVLELMIEVLIFNFEGPARSFVARFGNRIGLSPKA